MYFKRWTYFEIYLFIFFIASNNGCNTRKYTFEQMQYKKKRRWCAGHTTGRTSNFSVPLRKLHKITYYAK